MDEDEAEEGREASRGLTFRQHADAALKALVMQAMVPVILLGTIAVAAAFAAALVRWWLWP